jgi:hypothetical protein
MRSPLERLLGSSLAAELPDQSEFAGLKKSGLARLKDASSAANSLESRFDLAYNAAHAFCLAALRYRGFRPQNRYIVFQVLPHTLGLGPEVWRVLAKAHELRNLGEHPPLADTSHPTGPRQQESAEQEDPGNQIGPDQK